MIVFCIYNKYKNYIFNNMINQNSFSDNVANLTKNVNIAIDTLNAVTDSIVGDDDIITVKLPNDETVNILSQNNIINRLKNVENTVNSFTSGNGVVKLVDGTHRSVQVTTIPQTPKKITNLSKIDKFDINHNWFFEELMFPRMIVKYDLKDKIDDSADRIKISRIIIDISGPDSENIKNFYFRNINDKNISHDDLLNLLNYNNISYYEDEEILNFPLYKNDYFGKFMVTKSEIINGNLYYYLDTLYLSNYSNQNNIKLNIGDTLRFKQSIYKIVDVNDTFNRIDVKREIGLDSINVGEELEYYNDPFREKIIEIPIGINEINCLYFKGINELYNLIADEWSDMISFISNDLTYEDDNMLLQNYYMKYVSDFGRDMIAQIKEQRVLAYNGIKPNSVVLNKDNFRVVKINTQINASLDTENIKNTQSSILSLKSNIENLKNIIAKQKSDLLISNQTTRDKLYKEINNNTIQLRSLISEYSSSVEYLNTQLKDNQAIQSSPKYHIRGFFNIPEYQYIDSSNKLGKQEIIGFDIRYRYLKLNEVGTELSTFKYTDENGNVMSAVYSDWNMYQSTIKEKIYNTDTGLFEWVIENSADGNEININQIDIPISNGEKVEFMVRSISEAGYPNNPLKSDWSNSIIMEFPENFVNNDQLENILNDVKSEMTAIKLNDTLYSAGYYTHIDDEIVSYDDKNIIYHHNSDNIGYRDIIWDENTKKNKEIYISLHSKIEELERRLKELEK